jgi:hypothetical protein
MKIKITPFNNKDQQVKGDLKIKNNFYGGSDSYCGIITEIKKSDDWLDQEMSWVSRSEIPLITALRLAQLGNENEGILINGLIPIIRNYGPAYIVKEVSSFPNEKDCINLLMEYCGLLIEGSYNFKREIDENKIIGLFKSFDYKSKLLTRSGSCLYKAHILLNTSLVFSEEVYVNTYIALESIIELLKIKFQIGRKEVISRISRLGFVDFEEYEEEMRDGIRNDIIHPYRNQYKEKIAQPFIMADYIYEDLSFIDLLLKQFLEERIK